MSSRWVEVQLPVSGLMDMGLDDSSRARFAFNMVVTKEGSAEFDEEIKQVLVDGGMTADDIYLTSKAVLPEGDGPFVTVTLTPGLPGSGIHNANRPKYFRPGALVMAVGGNSLATRDLAWQALMLVTPVKNSVVA